MKLKPRKTQTLLNYSSLSQRKTTNNPGSSPSLPQVPLFEEIDIEKITASNFHTHMRTHLSIPLDQRTSYSTEVLKKCFTHLEFFQRIAELDPSDEMEAIQNSTQLLQYLTVDEGTVLLKHKEAPEEFYINLRGTVGAFIESSPEEVLLDLKAVLEIIKMAKFPNQISRREIESISELYVNDKKFMRTLLKFESIENQMA